MMVSGDEPLSLRLFFRTGAAVTAREPDQDDIWGVCPGPYWSVLISAHRGVSGYALGTEPERRVKMRTLHPSGTGWSMPGKRHRHRFLRLKIRFNSRMGMKGRIRTALQPEARRRTFFAQRMYESGGFSARRYHKALRVARTIADLEDSKGYKKEHLAEALGYRGLEEKIWG